MTPLLLMVLTTHPGQPVPRRRDHVVPRPAPQAEAAEVVEPRPSARSYPDRASHDAEVLRDARDRVVLAIGPEAKDFTKRYGAVGIYALLKCSPATGKRLVTLAASGGLDRLRDARVALDAVRIHGDEAAEWLADNAERLQDPEALQAFANSPMDFVYDLRDVEQAAEELRSARRFIPRAVGSGEGNQAYVLGGIALLVVAAGIYLRGRRAAG